MTVGQVLQTASKHENNSEANELMLELKQEREFYCSVCMWREMRDSDLLFTFPPHSSRKFQSGLDRIFFQFSILHSEKPIFWPKKTEESSKCRLIMITHISTM